MKFIPTSLIGWLFLFVGISGFIANFSSSTQNIIDLALQILFVYLLFFICANIFNFNKSKKSETIKNEKIKNTEINTLKEKLNILNEEDELNSLRNELNIKRLERGLISLIDYEQLDKDIQRKKTIYREIKSKYLQTIEDKNDLHTDRIFQTIVFAFVVSVPPFFGSYYYGLATREFLISFLITLLFGFMGVMNISKKNRLIKEHEVEIDYLLIEKNESLKEIKKLNKYFNQQTL